MGLAVDKGPSIVLALPRGSRHILEEKPGPGPSQGWDEVEAELRLWPWGLPGTGWEEAGPCSG